MNDNTQTDSKGETIASLVFFSFVILYIVWHLGRYYEYTQLGMFPY